MIENLIDYIENETEVKSKQLEEIENNKLRGLEDVSNYTCGQINGLKIILEYIKGDNIMMHNLDAEIDLERIEKIKMFTEFTNKMDQVIEAIDRLTDAVKENTYQMVDK
jgi:hypothetical protein